MGGEAAFVHAPNLLYGGALRGAGPGYSLPAEAGAEFKEHVADVFNEVEEELRAARYQAIVQKGWPYAAAALVLVLLGVVGVWGYNQHARAEQAKASNTYDQALQSLGAGDLNGADVKFASLAASAPPGYRTLALMQQAGIRVQKNKPAEAVRLFDQAAKVAPDDVLGDAARFKAALLLMQTRPLAEIQARLAPLIDDKRPYHLIAREARAMALLQAGRPQEAQADFSVLSLAQDVSKETSQRAEAARILIQTGSASVLPAAAKATPAVLPPPPQPSPFLGNVPGAAQ